MITPELATLYSLVDLLTSTQASNGSLVSPSTNPELRPVHSRAGEAVYPFAVAFKHSGDERYATAAIRLGNWLVSIQNASGSWCEEWPRVVGWEGTTVDQLLSLAGAYAILKERLTDRERAAWASSITRAADWTVAHFPDSNINYLPTGAVALLWASRVVPDPKPEWLAKAAAVMTTTLAAINEDDLLVGEGLGVDLGYNIAQSIGYIALYGLMLPDPVCVERAAALLRSHQHFMYPNGAIDNSWGTRSFKWTLESGTKTAPGVFFSFALLADQDPSFQRGAELALSYLEEHGRGADGWLVYGPHASRHSSSSPPSNYGAFARAQSLALAVEFAPESSGRAPIPADQKNWLRYFPSVKTAVIRTEKIMATVTAYAQTAKYPRETVARGGSAALIWFDGYGSTGFIQASSVTVYRRIEPMHMPIEDGPLPLTPRIETIGGPYFASVLDDQATLSVLPDGFEARGVLRSVTGESSGIAFTWSHSFGPDSYTKELTVSSCAGLRIVEPFIDDTGNRYALEGPDTFSITTASGTVYQLRVLESSGPYSLTAGTDRARYWAPFPGLDAYPLIIEPCSGGEFRIKYEVSRRSA